MKVRLRQHFWDDALLSDLAKGSIPRDFVEVEVGCYANQFGVGGNKGTWGIPRLGIGSPITIYGAEQAGVIHLDGNATSGTSYSGMLTKAGKKIYISPDLYNNGSGFPPTGGDSFKAYPLKDMLTFDQGTKWDWNLSVANYNPVSASFRYPALNNAPVLKTIPVELFKDQSSGPTQDSNYSKLLGYTAIPLTPALEASILDTAPKNVSPFIIRRAFFSTYRQRFIFVIATKDGKVYVVPSLWAKPVKIKKRDAYVNIYEERPNYSTYRNLGNLTVNVGAELDPEFSNDIPIKMEGSFVFDSLAEPVVEFDDLSKYNTVQIKSLTQSAVYKVEKADYIDERIVDISALNSKTIFILSESSQASSNVYGAQVDWIGTSITQLMNKFQSCGATPVFISAHESDPSKYEGVLVASDNNNWYIAHKGVNIDMSLSGTLFLDQFTKTPVATLAFDNYSHVAYTVYVRSITALFTAMARGTKPILEGIIGVLPKDMFKFDGDVWDSAFGSAQSLGELIKERAAKQKESELDPSHSGGGSEGSHPTDKPSTKNKSESDYFKVGLVFGAIFIGVTLLRK